MIQHVLADPAWMDRMLEEDLRALTPLLYRHVNPYGRFRLDMTRRIALDQAGGSNLGGLELEDLIV